MKREDIKWVILIILTILGFGGVLIFMATSDVSINYRYGKVLDKYVENTGTLYPGMEEGGFYVVVFYNDNRGLVEHLRVTEDTFYNLTTDTGYRLKMTGTSKMGSGGWEFDCHWIKDAQRCEEWV